MYYLFFYGFFIKITLSSIVICIGANKLITDLKDHLLFILLWIFHQNHIVFDSYLHWCEQTHYRLKIFVPLLNFTCYGLGHYN